MKYINMLLVVRLAGRSLFTLTLLFTLVIVLIHTQPYDDGGLREFLIAPSTCAAPCFIGIHPGVTSGEAALALLNANDWTRDTSLTYMGISERNGIVDWQWNGRQPGWLLPFPSRPILSFNKGLVRDITIPTSVRLGDIWLAFGDPDAYVFTISQGIKGTQIVLLYSVVYRGAQFWVTGSNLCPYYPSVLHSQITIHIGNMSDFAFLVERFPFRYRNFTAETLNYQHIACEKR
jgi:hypothetical protein